jgi:hypothetical protein
VQASLKDTADRKHFYLYNNGLTIVCEKFGYNPDRRSDLIVQVTGPQIVNGGQTCRIIQQTAAEVAISGDTLEEASVLVRLYEVPKESVELAARIALSTNSQNPVDLRDLRSGDAIQRQMELAIEKYEYSYHRFRADKVVRGANRIPAPLAAEAVLAVWRCLPTEAKLHKKDHFGSKYYDRIFSSDLTAGQLILATKILRLANRKSAANEENCAICRHGSHYIAMIVGCLLLREVEIPFERIQRDEFQKLDTHFEKNDEKLFGNAVAIMEERVRSFPEGQPYNGPQMPALFRSSKFRDHVLTALKGGK